MMNSYLFEAKGIQKWVLDGNRLVDIQTASAMLASAIATDMPDLLERVLAHTKFSPEFTRRAGGAFAFKYREDDKAAFLRFRALWRLTFMQLLPGLEFSEGLAENDDSAYLDVNRSLVRDNSSASLVSF